MPAHHIVTQFPSARPQASLWRAIWAKKHCYLYLLPTMSVLFLFLYYPVLSAVIHSFTQWDGFQPAQFIGFANYLQFFRDPNMPIAIRNMFFFSFGHLACDLVTSVGGRHLDFRTRPAPQQSRVSDDLRAADHDPLYHQRVSLEIHL